MKSLARWTTIVCFALTLILHFPSSGLTIEDAIIAVVNDELITLKDLRDYAQATYISLKTSGMPEDQIKPIMEAMETEGTDKLIEDRLILSEANKIGLEIREELVNKRIKEIKDQYPSEQSLTNALISSGVTLTDLKNKIRDEMKLKYIVDHQVRSKVYINPQEVTDYYAENKNRFGRNERVNLESIFIAYNEDKIAALVKANEAKKKITEGNDFTNITKEYSEMPSVGMVERGQLLPLIEETIFALELDEISSLVETESGIYIFKLIGKSPAQIAALQDVKSTIHEMLFKEKFKARFMEWVETLKKDAYIEIK